MIVLILSLGAASSSWAAKGGFHAEPLATGVRIFFGDKPVLEYRSVEGESKPYVSKLFTPTGLQILRDSPPDHQHHHALMFAVGVDDVNFWHESPGSEGSPIVGRQRGGKLRCSPAGDTPTSQSLSIEQDVDWLDGAGRPLVHEQRSLVTRYAYDPHVLILTWTSRLSASDSQKLLRLKGERYFGLGMRFVKAMDRAGKFSFARDRDVDPVNVNENLVRASWCSYVAKLDDQEVTVAVFGDPRNERHPTLWFTMVDPFAYLTATLGLHDRQFELRRAGKLELSYAIAVSDGALGSDTVERLFQLAAPESIRRVDATNRSLEEGVKRP